VPRLLLKPGGELLLPQLDSHNAFRLWALVIGVVASLGLGLLLVEGDATDRVLPMMVGLSAVGLSGIGVQASLYVRAAHAYPTACRASGIGWAAGIGRCGAVFSAALGGLILGLGSGPTAFFGTVCLLFLLCGVGVVIVNRHTPALSKPAQIARI
jgi:AAHS family 4-hydroxybenzoate transporter-like MFS transporter